MPSIAAKVIGRIFWAGLAVASIVAGWTIGGGDAASLTAAAAGRFAVWPAIEVGAPAPPPPEVALFVGRAEGTLADAIVIASAYRSISTVATAAAWGIAIGEVVATAEPKLPPPPLLIVLGDWLGEAASDDGTAANLVG